jgi:DegV family protein with EDD domain
MKILISTDTSCLVSSDCLKKYDINVFPLNVIIDGEEFLDGVTINQAQLKDAMRSNKKIQTSTPPLGEVIEYFENLLKKDYDHIIHFTISSKLSSMFDLFTNVAKSNFAGKVTVIDSLCLSVPMLAEVFTAYKMANSGSSVEEIVKAVEDRKGNDYVVFIPENLTALKNGGRISPTIAAIGNIIGMKPVIMLKDGALEKIETTNKIKRAFTQRVDECVEKYLPSEYDYSFINFDADESSFNYIYDYVQNKVCEQKVINGIIPINVCAHCGPGTMGLLVTKKINGESINELI